MRTVPIEKNHYYHIFNRGNQKQKLFFDERDYARCLFLVLHFQSPVMFAHLERQVDHYLKTGSFKILAGDLKKIDSQRHVELINFCIMPNHFHLTLFNKEENGIPRYMHRVSNALGKYFNTKYERTGHVFQGTYKAVPVLDDNQLSYLSAYIHKNPKELSPWKSKEERYPWSSFCDYKENRWGPLLKPDIVVDRFNNFDAYKKFVKESTVKADFFTKVVNTKC